MTEDRSQSVGNEKESIDLASQLLLSVFCRLASVL
jgi:hypothetical protein